mgnify:CR=1 FL=1
MNSRECLSLLNLSSDASSEDIKLAYRKAVKQWHPDRHQQASALVRETAEKKMQALNTAYSILSGYYNQHGHLPGYVSPEVVTTSFSFSDDIQTKTSEDEVPSSFHRPQHDLHSTDTLDQKTVSAKKSTGLIGVSVIIIAIFIYYSIDGSLLDNTDETNRLTNKQTEAGNLSSGINNGSPTATPPKEQKENDIAKDSPFAIKKRTSAFAPSSKLGIYEESEDSKYFTYGDTGGRVFEIQGVPTKTVGDIWYYGESEVHFQDGRVKSWVKLDNRLKTKK